MTKSRQKRIIRMNVLIISHNCLCSSTRPWQFFAAQFQFAHNHLSNSASEYLHRGFLILTLQGFLEHDIQLQKPWGHLDCKNTISPLVRSVDFLEPGCSYKTTPANFYLLRLESLWLAAIRCKSQLSALQNAAASAACYVRFCGCKFITWMYLHGTESRESHYKGLIWSWLACCWSSTQSCTKGCRRSLPKVIIVNVLPSTI